MALWFQCFSVMCGCGAWLTADACAMLVFLYEWAENAQRRNNEMVDYIEAECRQFCCLGLGVCSSLRRSRACHGSCDCSLSLGT